MSGSNDDPTDLPSPFEIVRQIAAEQGEPRWITHPGPTADWIAGLLGVRRARRLGNGATKGSWSGYMAPGLRLNPRLQKLKREGLLGSLPGDRSRLHWFVTREGLSWLAEHEREQERLRGMYAGTWEGEIRLLGHELGVPVESCSFDPMHGWLVGLKDGSELEAMSLSEVRVLLRRKAAKR